MNVYLYMSIKMYLYMSIGMYLYMNIKMYLYVSIQVAIWAVFNFLKFMLANLMNIQHETIFSHIFTCANICANEVKGSNMTIELETVLKMSSE